MGTTLDGRKTSILFSVIEEYVQTALPVASQAIVAARAVDASPATVRNEMSELEDEGYLAQPHTSAGRVPTEQAYRLYIEYVQRQQHTLVADVRVAIHRILFDAHEVRMVGKAIAHLLADSAAQAIVVGFARGDAYATGISYVIAQPEFQDRVALHEFSSAVDRLDETLETLDAMLNGTSRVIIGSENPFGPQCSAVASHLALPPSFAEASEGKEGQMLTLGIVGPMRMAYDRQLGLLETVRQSVDSGHAYG